MNNARINKHLEAQVAKCTKDMQESLTDASGKIMKFVQAFDRCQSALSDIEEKAAGDANFSLTEYADIYAFRLANVAYHLRAASRMIDSCPPIEMAARLNAIVADDSEDNQ